MIDELQEAISRLPELYQPLFGQDPEGTVPSRICADRLDAIVAALAPFEHSSGTIVDVGSAQGFFTLSLAERFPEFRSIGLDILEQNVSVANMLSDSQSRRAEFRCVDVRAGTLDAVIEGETNCLLLLNVLHHICTRHGWAETDRLLEEVSRYADIAIVELASASENLGWTKSLPAEDDMWFRHFAFSRSLGWFDTHISGVKRQMHVCSSKWVLTDHGKYPVSRVMDRSHAGAFPTTETGRRYFLSERVVAKCYALTGPLARRNKLEMLREAAFLQLPPADFPAPQLLDVSINRESGVLVRECLDGDLLSDRLARPCPRNEWLPTMKSIGGALVALEAAGLYHHDLRPWNALLTEQGGIQLIDFGSISKRRSRAPYEDFVEFGYWLLDQDGTSGLWGCHRARVSSIDVPPCLAGLSFELDSSATSSLTFARFESIIKASSPTDQWRPMPRRRNIDPDSWEYLAVRADRAIRGIGRLTAIGGEARVFAQSLLAERSRQHEEYLRQLEACAAELRTTQSDARRQVDSLVRRAERAEAHWRQLAVELRLAREELSTTHDEAMRQLEAFAQRASTAEEYAKSLEMEVARLRCDAGSQIAAFVQRSELAEQYAKGLEDQLAVRTEHLSEVSREVAEIKQSRLFRYTTWLR